MIDRDHRDQQASGSGDPFDFGINFKSSAVRVRGERDRRRELAEKLLKFHVPILDDQLRGIFPNDLILVGAETGVGKTELARMIAMGNVRDGKRAHYFALEAEPDEIERRTKFTILAELAHGACRNLDDLNYADWYLGRCEHIVGDLEDEAEDEMHARLAGLQTFYRGRDFGFEDIKRMFLAIQDETDLILLDHLHYVDLDDERNENAAYKQIVKTIRDTALSMGKPVLVVVHLKKRDVMDRALVPDINRVHGSSDISKIATRTIMLAPARGEDLPRKGGFANTFIGVEKDRMSGKTPFIAHCRFDLRFRTYEDVYTLGRAAAKGAKGGEIFDPLDLADVPRWAKRHRPLMKALVAGETV